MTFEEYQTINATNASFLKACSFGLYQGFQYLHRPAYESDAMDFGKAVHCALLEPELFNDQFCLVPMDAPKKLTKTQEEAFEKFPKLDKPTAAQVKANAHAKSVIEWWDKFDKTAHDKVILSPDDFTKIEQIKKRCYANDAVKEAMDTFEKEKTVIFGNHEFKARLDLVDVKNGVVIDVKTTRDASPYAFVKQLLSLRYHIQMLHYCKAVNATTAYVIAIESDTAEVALYDITDIVFSPATVAMYEKSIETARIVKDLKECPPKFELSIVNLKMPEWAEREIS
jgi:hypothetical protein